MPRRVVVLLVAALLVTGVFAPAVVAQDEPAMVAPCFSGEYTAEPGQTLNLHCGWGTIGGPGRIVTYLNSYSAELTIRDASDAVVFTIDADELATLWGSMITTPNDDEDLECAGPTAQRVMWHDYLDGGLAAGTYYLEFRETLRHPVNDGAHTCWWVEDGSRLVPAPSLTKGSWVTTSTLVVGP